MTPHGRVFVQADRTAPTAESAARRRFARPRKRELAFLGFGAAVFAAGLIALPVVCIACQNPATFG